MKKIILFSVIAAAFIPAICRGAEPTVENRRTASNYYAYPYPEFELPALTAAPAGYEPFHIEHYGRHGSRWHIGEWVYRSPIDELRSAERNGKLTARGKELLSQLREIEMASRGRDGELTPLGAAQHRGIARRMTANFPEVFAGDAYIQARSTDVVRCILSMDNEMLEFRTFNPVIDITTDASKRDVRYLNFSDKAADSIAWARNGLLQPIEDATPIDYNAFALQLVDDPQFVADSVNARGLFEAIFRIAANAQSHYDQKAPYDLFTDSQLHNQWVRDNAGWFLSFGNTAHTGGAGPQRQRYLMRNWIESADTAVMSQRHGANMRFGHEVVVMPMAVLMQLDDYGDEINDLATLEKRWHNYDLLPMASNIQMIFYRPAGKGACKPDDVLVKVLYNEKEMRLPAKPVSGPYYRWTDVRRVWLDRIGPDGGIFPDEKPY